MSDLVDDNIACLRQGLDLLNELDDANFAEGHAACYGSSIGQHMRHNIDHFYSLLRGLSSGEIDYDARARDPRLETETTVAREALEEIIAELQGIGEGNLERPLSVIMDSGAAVPKPAQSTLRRELQFLLSHTVHHFALISVMLRLNGAEPPPGFGVAPSTLKHQQSN